jgi:hypothetical protein
MLARSTVLYDGMQEHMLQTYPVIKESVLLLRLVESNSQLPLTPGLQTYDMKSKLPARFNYCCN